MLDSGSLAPNFCLPDQSGCLRALAEFLHGGPLLVYFCPAVFTPGCAREAGAIRDLHGRILELGLQVVGISPRSPDSHRRFRARHDLRFDLLSDVDRAVIRLYDVDGPFGFGVRRTTYLVDGEGVIRDGVLADLRLARHAAFIHDVLAVAERDRGAPDRRIARPAATDQ